MSAVLEQLQQQLAGLQAQVDAEAQTALAAMEQRHQAQLAAMQRDCAIAMEAATANALRTAEADRLTAIAIGRSQERERTLLLIQLVAQQWRAKCSNAQALAMLRSMVEGDAIDG